MKTTSHESGRSLKLKFWLFGWWGYGFFPTDIGQCWAWAKVRPRWYWMVRRVRLFCELVWRIPVEGGVPIQAPTAWEVSKIAEGVSIWRLS